MRLTPLRRMAPGVLLACACACDAAYNEGTFGDIDVRIVPSPYADLYHGYAQHDVRVVNRSATLTHAVTLVMRTTYGGRYSGLTSIERSISVGPGATVNASLLQPPLAFPCNRMHVVVDGRPGSFDVRMDS